MDQMTEDMKRVARQEGAVAATRYYRNVNKLASLKQAHTVVRSYIDGYKDGLERRNA